MKSLVPLFGSLIVLTGCTPDSASPDEKAPSVAVEENPGEPAVRDIALEHAKQLVDKKEDLIILDVRTPQEFADGHLAGAKNIDYLVDEADFRTALDGLDRAAPILMHCQSGGRSAHVVEIMTEMDFENVSHLEAGFAGWKEAGYPVEK